MAGFWALLTLDAILAYFVLRLRRLIISAAFTEAERQRFHNLLQLAAESPFEGERSNLDKSS